MAVVADAQVVDDWSVDHLRIHARERIAGTGEAVDDEIFGRLAARLSYVQGDPLTRC